MPPNNVPHLYFDTNFILDVIVGRNNKSIHIFETAKEKKWFVGTSSFAIMETVDTLQERKFFMRQVTEEYTPIRHIQGLMKNREFPKGWYANLSSGINPPAT